MCKVLNLFYNGHLWLQKYSIVTKHRSNTNKLLNVSKAVLRESTEQF
jgi:hypothetical protein